MNHVTLTGRLTEKPERKSTASGTSVVNFTLAVDKFTNGEKSANFIKCVAYKNKADFIRDYCNKGDKLGVEGSVETRSYEDSSGRKVYVTEIFCDRVELEAKAQNNAQEPQKPTPEPRRLETGPDYFNLNIEDIEEDLPF